MSALLWILAKVQATDSVGEVVAAMMNHFVLTSAKAAKSYLRVGDALGLIEVTASSVYLTKAGAAYLKKPSSTALQAALRQNIQGCEELLAILRKRPLRIGRLLEEMAKEGHGWTTDSQLRYRLRWLEEAGVVERRGKGRPEYRLVSLSGAAAPLAID